MFTFVHVCFCLFLFMFMFIFAFVYGFLSSQSLVPKPSCVCRLQYRIIRSEFRTASNKQLRPGKEATSVLHAISRLLASFGFSTQEVKRCLHISDLRDQNRCLPCDVFCSKINTYPKQWRQKTLLINSLSPKRGH